MLTVGVDKRPQVTVSSDDNQQCLLNDAVTSPAVCVTSPAGAPVCVTSPAVCVTSPAGAPLCGVTCQLDNKELWDKFHALGTEMIITKSGRSVRVQLFNDFNKCLSFDGRRQY